MQQDLIPGPKSGPGNENCRQEMNVGPTQSATPEHSVFHQTECLFKRDCDDAREG